MGSFLTSASELRPDFPILRLLDKLPAVFVNESFVEAATAWIASHPAVRFVVGSADELSRASAALANAQEGISTEPVVRSLMFATAPVGIGRKMSIWVAVAAF